MKSKNIKKTGKYFWKVLLLDAEDGSVLAKTKVSSFKVLQLPLIEIAGNGKVRGLIIANQGGAVKISTPKGVIKTTMDQITGVEHAY